MTVNAELSSLKESYWDKKEAVVSTDALPAVTTIYVAGHASCGRVVWTAVLSVVTMIPVAAAGHASCRKMACSHAPCVVCAACRSG